jgi:uncharacterized protein YndB with AHSA1/START domain
MKQINEPIVVEKQLDFPIETVWNAITQLDQMKLWFFEQIEAFEPVVGFETSFIVKSDERVFSHLWKISEVNPPNRITTNWKFEGYPGDSFVTFELQTANGGTLLKVVNKIVEGFAGWEYFLDRLHSYLQK